MAETMTGRKRRKSVCPICGQTWEKQNRNEKACTPQCSKRYWQERQARRRLREAELKPTAKGYGLERDPWAAGTLPDEVTAHALLDAVPL